MYKELTLYDKNLTEEDTRSQLFIALNHKIGGFCTSTYFLPMVSDLIPHGLVLSCPINFPDGMGDFKVTQHSILTSIRKGANSIDLVINPHLLSNRKYETILEEVTCYQKICKDNNATLRIMLEYRAFDSTSILDTISLLVDMNIEYVFPSTGYFADDFNDNLVITQLIAQKYPNINVISTVPIWHRSQYETVKELGIFGLRFYKTSVLKELGV